MNHVDIARPVIGGSFPCTTESGETVVIVRTDDSNPNARLLYDADGCAWIANGNLTISLFNESEGPA